MTKPETDPKLAAIEKWTADPIAAELGDGEPGTAAYLESLLRARAEYAPWMAEALGYGAGESEVAHKDVLDVGCGQAIDVVGFARAGATVTGVDLTPRHVELARMHVAALGLDATIVEGDAETLPFEDESFDWVSSNGVLHHTPDMPAALREIRRVLRPGGTLRLTVYNRNSLHYWVDQVLAHGILKGKLFRERSMAGVLSTTVEHAAEDARPLVRVYSRRQVRTMLARAGFADVRTQVRHFHAHDAFVVERLSRRFARLRDPQVLDRIGRSAGWYIVAGARKP